MNEALHLWALAPTAVGACCVAADRGRPRVPELAAAALMLLAMADAATGTAVIAPVYWTGLLLAAAMGLAVLRGSRRVRALRPSARASGAGAVSDGVGRGHRSAAMTAMTAVGAVVMALLVLLMGADPAAAGAGHHHGIGAGGLAVVAVAMAVAYGAGSAVLIARGGLRPLDRVQHASMGFAALLMAAGGLV